MSNTRRRQLRNSFNTNIQLGAEFSIQLVGQPPHQLAILPHQLKMVLKGLWYLKKMSSSQIRGLSAEVHTLLL